MLRSVAVAVFVVGWLPVFLLRSERFHARRAVATPEERRSMWNAAAAVTVHITLVEMQLAHGDGPIPTAQLVVGLSIFGVGLAFWLLARHTLVGYGRLLDPSAAPPALVTTGPFAIVRHPLALGMVILALGPAIAASRGISWASFAAATAAMARRCVQDEIELAETFGHAYARYAETTPRLIPFLW